MPTPTIVSVAPGEIAVGDTVQVIGEDFVPPDHGTMSIQITGTYTADNGEENAYTGDIPLEWKQPGIAEFVFGPNVIFHETGDRIGVFHGSARAVNHAGPLDDDGAEQRVSDTHSMDMTVLPSIILVEMRSIDGNCSAITNGTTSDSNLSLAFKAIGLGAASAARPMQFDVVFTSPTIKVQYVKNQSFDVWPFEPTTGSYAQAPDGNTMLSHRVTSGSTLFIEPREREMVFTVNPAAQIGSQAYSEVKLNRLWAGTLEGPGPLIANFYVTARNFDGDTADRAILYKIHNEAEFVPYNGSAKLVERYSPEQTQGCFPGGTIGTDLSYSEGTSITRTRSVSVRWDLSAGVMQGLQVGAQIGTGFSSPIQFGVNLTYNYGVNWQMTFGTDASESVSSEEHINLMLSVHILPSFFGTCYRQVERIERTVPVVVNNTCGASMQIGEATMTDWNFSFDVAQGPSCPPPTNLPGAEIFD